MYAREVSLFGLAYILGLLIASGFEEYWLTIIITLSIAAIVFIKVAPNYNWWGLRQKTGLGIFIVFLIAFFSFYLRFPTPANNDVSKIIPPAENGISTTVVGEVLNSPTLNRSGKLRFWLSAEIVGEETHQTQVTGKLYTTIPTDFEKGVYPHSKIQVTGYLYQPQMPRNPGQFDFNQYLNQNGAFVGISGREVRVLEEGGWGFWKLRDRVINVHQKALGSPKGELVSSMVLGRKAVNLPDDLQDQFLKAGLAHILAASGFHVSLLLGFVLAMTQRLNVSVRFGIGVGILLLYVGLTGLQPSILRASLMGVAGLLGLLTERKVDSTRSLLVIATILLLINPLWIIDLGFQFSFLATFGLIVTVPALLTRLDFIPPTIASLIAVPIAVYPWVFPLQLFHFGTVVTYSILLNVLVTPFAIFLILGGMISGFIGLLIPDLGSAIAVLLAYPTQFLINIISGFNQLPGSYWLFGKIALWQLIIVSVIVIYLWQSSPEKRYTKLGIIGAIALIIMPITYKQLTLRQVTIFADKEPIVFVQNYGKTTLINCGDEDTIRYTILPFLQQEGIQKVDSAIALARGNNWLNLVEKISIDRFFYNPILEEELSNSETLPVISKQKISLNDPLIQDRGFSLNQINPSFLAITLGKKQFGLLKYATQIAPNLVSDLRGIDFLLWEGDTVAREWLDQLNPKNAIAVTNKNYQKLTEQLQAYNTEFYHTGEHGAIQWTPRKGLTTMLN